MKIERPNCPKCGGKVEINFYHKLNYYFICKKCLYTFEVAKNQQSDDDDNDVIYFLVACIIFLLAAYGLYTLIFN